LAKGRHPAIPVNDGDLALIGDHALSDVAGQGRQRATDRAHTYLTLCDPSESRDEVQDPANLFLYIRASMGTSKYTALGYIVAEGPRT
jgi:hypothetical protein